MGEGRNDRSGKRQRASNGLGKSSSDSEIAHGKSKGRKVKVKEKWPYSDGLTVDELARYRRRRIQSYPKDNLSPCPEPLDKDFLSEYRRAFRASSEDILKENRPIKKQPEDFLPIGFLRLEGSCEDIQPTYRDDFKEYENIELPIRRRGPAGSFYLANGNKAMETETESSRFIAHRNPPQRPSLVRRGTSLRREGDFYSDTETFSSYVAYEGQHKPELARRPTSLKMEGDLDTMTEKCEKFIEWLNVSRPELMRVPTHLKLEGDLETSTENHDKYIPFVGVRRPELLRQTTNLKLEGESTFLPEYTDVFKKHNITERPQPMKPETHLKTGRNLFKTTEATDNYVHPRAKETQLMEELNRDVEAEEKRRREKGESKKKEEEMKMLVSKLEDLKGPPLGVPEYKDAYKDFPRERSKIIRPEDEIGRADGSKIPSLPNHSKFSTKIDQDPEYKSRYIDYPRDRPVYRKPPLTLRPTVISSGRNSFSKPVCQESRRYEFEPTSEVKSQYVSYGQIPRVETIKMPANLRLEGNLDLQPEYKVAYCTKRDYQSCNEPRMHRRRDRSLSASRRKDNYWMSTTDTQRFGGNNAQDQDAFQILNTRVHEDSVVGKPPAGSRRGSRVSQVQTQKCSQMDLAERNTLRTRSPSPTYRLHVCNVDDEPRGFARRKRSPSLQSSDGVRCSSPDRVVHEDFVRPYSPSFGRDNKLHADSKSFVVLDNVARDSNKNERRRRRVDRNRNIDHMLPMSRERPRTPTNWMPPWYDSTNTI